MFYSIFKVTVVTIRLRPAGLRHQAGTAMATVAAMAMVTVDKVVTVMAVVMDMVERDDMINILYSSYMYKIENLAIILFKINRINKQNILIFY